MNGRTFGLSLVVVVAALAGTASCGDDGGVAENNGGSGAVAGSSGSGGSGATAGVAGSGGQSSFADFPDKPILEGTLPADLPSQFSGGDPTGGPCLTEPPLEALVPKNWTPLLFEWNAPADQNVFELTLSVDNQVNDLVVYTDQTSYSISADVWNNLTAHSAGRDVMVKVRGAKLDGSSITAGPFTGVEGTVYLAPVGAPGSVVYWTSGPPGAPSPALKGFTIGDTQVSTVLTPAIVDSDTQCVACHVSAPDGAFTFYTRDSSAGRAVDVRSVDGNGTAPPASVATPTALSLLARNKQAAPVLSKAHYSPTDAFAISVFVDATATNGAYELIWTDLHATDPASGWGILARTGDPRQVATPTWWHDGSTIAYTSSPVAGEGVISRITDADPTMDIYTVPYANHAGGAATPLPGASDAAYWEFYPVISPEDALLAFNRCEPRKEMDGSWADSYNEPTAEVFVVPAGGGTATRIEANDPAACASQTSPGITNSWPRWAPTAEVHEGKKYYWLVFSSTRRQADNPQLFVSGVVTDETTGAIVRTYPALYVTSQVAEENNHTPAWDFFQVVPR